ncbi:UNVERIFIED_CONTAM: putative disease resistance protein RGA3 [Sesamum angustifolium]|uniref:Disease resistance protein RGA3 n=1 Tax=Sesamum angustifolium TaxID=2727405 RepID=A0AAW2LLW6_9LAMI
MADAIVPIALQRLADVIQKQIQEEVNLVRGVKKEVLYLSSELDAIRNVLEDAERRRYKEKSIQDWLKKLEDISCDVYDVLDEWNSAILKLHLPRMIKEKDRYDFIVNHPVAPQETTRVQSTSSIDLSEIQGREADKHVLVSKLMRGVSSRQEHGPHVISIVGTGGIGKTTLAQFIYHDDCVVNCFELKIWVCVSDVYNEVKIVKAILESVTRISQDLNELEALLKCLKDSISGQKFLLVLDDVWIEDYTRGNGDYEELQEIGREIANKCKGLPLAAKVLGSLLRFKDTKEELESVLDSEIWQLEEAEVEIFPHLFLSYNELSPALKRCFSYCAVFPKDWRIDVNKLIKMWMALGYLTSNGSTDDLELKGKEYFNNLRMRSFFQDVEEYGDRVYCKMHDIVHDFAKFLRKTTTHNFNARVEARTNSSFKLMIHL